MGKKKKKFYVVWKGHTPGIYDNWADCQQQTAGYSGPEFKSFESEAAAKEAYGGDYTNYVSKGGGGKKKTPKVTHSDLERLGVVMESLAVDAACAGNPGPVEFQGVDTETGAQIFHYGPYEDGTVNLGEFAALVLGLKILKEKGKDWPIYTDSRTAMAWVRNKKMKTQLTRTPRNKKIFAFCDKALEWLRENDYTTQILKWKTEDWGEIPADFGRK